MNNHYQSKDDISSACSEIFEYLLKKTYDEENPFGRFADAEIQMYGPNTLENSLAIEERERRDYTTEPTDVFKGASENDIIYMKDASSSNSVNVGSVDSLNYEPDEERRCYTRQCLCGMICNNLRRCIQSVSSLCVDDEAFDNEYLEMLRSFNDEGLVTDTDSDRCLCVDDHIHGIPEGKLRLNSYTSSDPSQLLLMARSNPELTISKEDFLRCMCGQGDIKYESMSTEVSRVYDACAKILSIILTMNTLYIMKYVVFNLVYRNLAMN